MQKLSPFLPLLLMVLLSTCVSAQQIPLVFEATIRNQIGITPQPDGSLLINTLGADPWVRTVPLTQSYDHEQVYVLSFDYESATGLDNLQVFYGLQSAARRVDFGELRPTTNGPRTFKAFMKLEAPIWTEAYDRFRFDFGRFAGQSLTLSNLQLRAATPTEVIPLTLNIDERLGTNATVAADGSVTLTTNSIDPWIATFPFTTAYDPSQTYVLSYRYQGDALDDFRVFFGEPYDPARMALFGPLPSAAAYTAFSGFMPAGDPNWLDGPVNKLRFDFGREAGKTITVSDFYLREPTNAEANAYQPPVVVETVDLELDVNNTSAGLSGTETAPGEYLLNTTGNDPWIRSKTVTALYNIDSSYIISFEYRAPEAYNTLEIFFGPPINATQLLTTEQLPAAAEWTTYVLNPRLYVDNFQTADWTDFRFDFGRQENTTKQIEIRNLKLRKPTPQERLDEENSDKFRSRIVNQQFNAYLASTFPDRVTEVKVDSTQVTIRGELSGGTGPYFLAEINPEDYGFDLETFDHLIPLAETSGSFSVQQPRFAPLADRQKDRLYARWAVVTPNAAGTYTRTSALHWATHIAYAAENNLPEDKATTIKGLDGLTPGTLGNFNDLLDLDIKSMKINLVLNGVFALNPGANTTTYDFNGKTYHINQTFVDNLDARIKICSDNGIKPAFVLLIPISFTNAFLDSIFTHPDARLGLYSMANVTDARGVEHYTMLVDFLSRRYSRPDQLYGRLDQWIIHNEVDAHTSWTHAGEKPAPLYTQIYDRSMRLVHYTIRKHNPTAKVFSSLTKHFASKVGGEAGPNFRSREILTVQGKLMQLEGDYEWGIGWHSYPTNLRNPAVWQDAISATPLSYDAAQITPRNLEVIDGYVRQKSVLYNGRKVRTILLSENGFSSNVSTNPTFTQERQAAAVAYFWKKTNERLSAIENIQYHRWVDNPNEGGLEFGLWTVLPGTIEGFNEKKPSWYVWQAAGTPEEDAVFAPYKAVIGISDWSEIQFAFATETTPYRVLLNVVNCDADLTDVLVSFNGEHRIPQADGTVQFFNVASNVAQPLAISKGGVLLVQDTLAVDADLELAYDLGAVAGLSAVGSSPTTVTLSWTGAAAGAGYVVERSVEGGAYSEIARVDTTVWVDSNVVAANDYAYRVAAELAGGSALSCFSDPVAITAPYIVVDYRNADLNQPGNNKIAPQLRLRNVSDLPVAISELTVRYWFTAENLATLNFFVDYAALGTSAVAGTFTALPEARDGASHYLELGFNTAYQIPANGNTGDIKTRIAKANYSNFAEADDHSYANVGSYVESSSITVYRNGVLIWGAEPAVSAVQAPALRVVHRTTDNANNNSIKPELNLVNDGNVGVDLADVTLRYWFTPEGSAALQYALDYSLLNASLIGGQFVAAGDRPGGSHYFEVGFDPALGQLAARSETGPMKFRFFKQDWPNFSEADDHSYLATGAWLDNAWITAYLGDELVWGEEPDLAPLPRPAPSTATTAPAFSAQVFPNPAREYTDLVWGGDVERFENVHLVGVNGTRHAVTAEIAGQRLRLRFGAGLPAGLYLVGGTVNGEPVVSRVVIRR
ncbi:DUF5722 domain-containing protein [Neolewinella lacunae]|uniref:Uncharacterized protein n=1 Tax=Neolewinella lacunae TaxID=1517758 RepID=A0A923TAL6_9BACT|nr:DUF5722 domain-containing protein [Neolewinella lacunae]MBC6996609.1 hypothetical protein [Neolewinella lacunae]MDN3634827.1 DUF5722 domain-containing protein [Neolewinella lacunae]